MARTVTLQTRVAPLDLGIIKAWDTAMNGNRLQSKSSLISLAVRSMAAIIVKEFPDIRVPKTEGEALDYLECNQIDVIAVENKVLAGRNVRAIAKNEQTTTRYEMGHDLTDEEMRWAAEEAMKRVMAGDRPSNLILTERDYAHHRANNLSGDEGAIPSDRDSSSEFISREGASVEELSKRIQSAPSMDAYAIPLASETSHTFAQVDNPQRNDLLEGERSEQQSDSSPDSYVNTNFDISVEMAQQYAETKEVLSARVKAILDE